MSKFPKRIDARLEIKITESPETDPKRIALERRMNRAGAVCVLSLIEPIVSSLQFFAMCISANFCCSYLRYYFLCLSYQGLFHGRRAKRLMATGLCHGGWGAAIINYPRHQRSKPRPCLLLCGLRCGRGFVFTACLAVPWQGQQNFTIAMQSFSVMRYLNIEIAYSLP